MRIFDCIPFSSNFSSTIRRDAGRNACVHSKGRSGSEPEGSLVIKGQPLALMRPPATGEGRQLLVRNRTSQDFYDARFYSWTISALGPGCVKTRLGEECAELFSQLPSSKRSCQHNRLPHRRNRDGSSTCKLDIGIFTQPGSFATEMGIPRHVCFPPTATELRTSREVRLVP